MNRRTFLRVAAAAPLAAAAVQAAAAVHVHDWQKNPNFLGFSCACGATRKAR